MDYLEEYEGKLGISLTAEQLERFARYQALLLEWNQRINLTAAKSAQEIQVRHFVDSLTCMLATGDLNGRSLIDIGSGAGFPGLPLKIVNPHMELVLVESVEKKGGFLKEVVQELNLAKVSVVMDRAEVIGHKPEHRQRYDWAVARAVAPLSPLLEYLLPLCRVGGHALAQKGARAEEELLSSREAIEILGGKVVDQIPVPLTGEADAKLIVIEKLRDTPRKFPRRVGIPMKRPL